MLSFSTQSLPARERFDAWQAVVQQHLFGLTIEPTKDARQDFSGTFAAAPAGGGLFARLDATRSLVKRTARDIARSAGDAIVISRQGKGRAWWQAEGRGNSFQCGERGFVMAHSDNSFVTHPMDHAHHQVSMLVIPESRVRYLTPGGRKLPLRAVPTAHGLGALLAACFESFEKEVSNLTPDERETAVNTIAQLAAMVYAKSSAANQGSREAVRAARLIVIRQFVQNQLGRADLTPAVVARLFGLSVRQLHMLYEGSGTTFARDLAKKRIEHARALLVNRPAMSVTDVAHASGFASLATFYRVFDAAYHMTPSSARAGTPTRSGAR